MTSFSTYYDVLGISENASPEEMKKAYRKKAYATHPDRNGGNGERFVEVTTAWETLSDSMKRVEYDAAVQRMRNDELRIARNEEEDRLERERREKEAREKKEAEEKEAREKKEAEEKEARVKKEAEEKEARVKKEAEEKEAREKKEAEEKEARVKKAIEEEAARVKKEAEEKAARDALLREKQKQERLAREKAEQEDAERRAREKRIASATADIPDEVLEEALRSIRNYVSSNSSSANNASVISPPPPKVVVAPPPRRVTTPPPRATSMGSAFDMAYKAVTQEADPIEQYRKKMDSLRSSYKQDLLRKSHRKEQVQKWLQVGLHAVMCLIVIVLAFVLYIQFSGLEDLGIVAINYFASWYPENEMGYFMTHLTFAIVLGVPFAFGGTYLAFLADQILRWVRSSYR
jgi:curved DNA-binding protein CbpA